MKRIFSIFLTAFILLVGSIPAMAQDVDADRSVTDSFTHWELSNGKKTPVATRPVYTALATVNARSLGLTEIGNFIDIASDKNGSTYILTDSGRIICFDADLKFLKEYSFTFENGEAVDIVGSKGIYVHSPTEIYIADTEHGRVLYCVENKVVKEIGLPDSPLISSDFVYKPIRVARDKDDFLYVLSEGSYYGALLYDPEGEFVGFYGANTVKGGIISTISYLWDRLTLTDAKMANAKKTLPYQFSDICIDKNGFVYTCTDSETGQIRILSPGGTDIMSGSSDMSFGETDYVERFGARLTQSFVSVDADSDGFVYALDKSLGLIYIYDTQGQMIVGFGGGNTQGKQQGVFASAEAITVSGDRLLVMDSLRNSVTVFGLSEFGGLLMSAQELTLKNDYINAKPLWEQVLKYDAINRPALRGIAKAAYIEGDYTLAAEYAKIGNDAEIYSQARSKLQSDFISKNFIWIFPLCVLVIAGITLLLAISKKHKFVLIKNQRVALLFKSVFHPFAGFREIKEKGLGSWKIAGVMTGLYFFSSAAATMLSDFRYTDYNAESYNSLFQLAQTVGLILLWSCASWIVCTLMEGKGKFKEVFTVTSYSTLPIVFYSLCSIPLTYFMTDTSSAFLSGFKMICLIFTGIMLAVGTMIIQDFDFPKFLISGIVTVLLMILGIFVLFMLAVLLTQFVSFAVNGVLELIRWQ